MATTHGSGSPISVGTRSKLTREAEIQLLTKEQEYFTNNYPFGTKPQDLRSKKDLPSDDGRSGTRCMCLLQRKSVLQMTA